MKKWIYHEEEWFSLNTFEQKKIRDALIPLLGRYKRKIERLEVHPKNEGQADILEEISSLRQEKKEIRAIIDEFRT